MKKNNNTLIIFIIIIIVILVLLYYYFINISITQTEKYNCNIKNCPIITKDDDKLYKIYNEYKELRKKNVILQKSNIHNYFFKTKGPSNIFIIRHGEKIKGDFPLDCNGILRSTYISKLIETLNNKGYGIDSVITPIKYNNKEIALDLYSKINFIKITRRQEKTIGNNDIFVNKAKIEN